MALTGGDLHKAETLLAAAQRAGVERLAVLCRAAVERGVDDPGAILAATQLFSDDERQELADQLLSTLAPADLLGRSRIRRRAEQVTALRAGGGRQTFADQPTDLRVFDEAGPLRPMTPRAAVDYFRRLVPGLAVDAPALEAALAPRAFTLAVTTDDRLLDRVKQAIAERLEFGRARALVADTARGRVEFVANPNAPAGTVAVLADPRLLDEAWSKDQGYYIPPGGGGGEVPGRIEQFNRFLDTGQDVEVPVVTLDADGVVSFTDGRHRFAALRDQSANQVPVMVPVDQADDFAARFGSSVPPEDSTLTGGQAVDKILDRAGVSPAQPGYGEMVYRTNMMSAYSNGAQEELNAVADVFPWWKYANPSDGRSRPAHAARNGRYYPTAVSFEQVRGTEAADVIQCRCVQIPVDRWEAEELMKAGVRVEQV